MPATIRDIREQTGLSLATISKYLNGGNVLPENKVKIDAAIKDLHYEVNEIARGLVTNKTRTIGVVVFSVERIFCGTLIRYIGERLRREGYGMLICDSSSDEEIEAQNIRFLLSKKVDGIIVIPVSGSKQFLEPAKNAGVPVVLVDRPVSDSDFDCVKIDNRVAAIKAVELLIKNNHKDIAIIYGNEVTGSERYKGFLDAMESAGLKVNKDYCFSGRHSMEFGYQSMSKLLAMKKRPTAVFMTNYELTLGAVMAVNESRLKCPDDISMIGFDDLVLSHVLNPRMYMVAQPMKEMGEKAAEMILAHINSEEESSAVEINLSTKILEGNSISKI